MQDENTFDLTGRFLLIYDDIYTWQGWGGKLRLGSGKCLLRIYDLEKGNEKGLTFLRPVIVVASDVPDSSMSVRSCAGHIATSVTGEFKIDPHRMLFIEYNPATVYGGKQEHVIPERYEVVEFSWHENRAIQPNWRALKPPMLDVIKKLLQDNRNKLS